MIRRRPLLFATLVLAALALPAATSQAQNGAPYVLAETGQGFFRLQDAVTAVGDGAGTIRFAPGRYADCAVQTAGSITYLAATPGQSILDGTACEGKAALVLRGRSSRVEGLVFANIRVSEFNGAGIRLEKGNLTVFQSWFRDSQQGILTAGDPSIRLAIDKTTFTRLGTCEGPGGCAHSIYIGDIASLAVTRSRFEAGRGGHYVKSRSRQVAVLNSSFDDTAGRQTNYMIDLPGGAAGRIAGNWFVQGQSKENHSAFIAVAAEGRQHASAGLAIVGNDARFAPGVSRGSTFVALWTDDAVAIGTNNLGSGLKARDRR